MLNRARQSILLGQTVFNKFLDDAGSTPAVDELLPFAEWVTPVQVSRCELISRCSIYAHSLKEGVILVGGSMRGFMSRSYTIHRSSVSLTVTNEPPSTPLMADMKRSLPDSFIHPRLCERIRGRR